jgi:predicted DNA-binding transcriptional regulator YafY
MAGRGAGSCFNAATTALVQRKRLKIEYHGRTRGEVTDREISPQRLVHYRDNWYLDAWCHLRKGLRSFALERIRAAQVSSRAALDVAEAKLDKHFATAYGIFAGSPKQMAVLRFTAERARWVADEQWHPRQAGRFLDDGRYELEVPYSDPRELVMDILRHGSDVEVVAPAELRASVVRQLQAALGQYG